jgi:hypothetical protein
VCVCVFYVKVIVLYNSLIMFLLVWYKQDAMLFNSKQFEESNSFCRICLLSVYIIIFHSKEYNGILQLVYHIQCS